MKAREAICIFSVIVASGSLAGCGGASQHHTAASGASTSASGGNSSALRATPAPSPSATAAPTLPGSTRLTAITLQRADLPANWQPTPYRPSATDGADQEALVACVGGKNTDPDRTAEVHSPDYHLITTNTSAEGVAYSPPTNPGGTTLTATSATASQASVSSQAASYRKAADLEADIAIIHSPKIDRCFESLLKLQLATALPAGAAISRVAMAIRPGPGPGPSNVIGTGQGSVTVTAESKTEQSMPPSLS